MKILIGIAVVISFLILLYVIKLVFFREYFESFNKRFKSNLYDLWLKSVVWMYIGYRLLKIFVIMTTMGLGFIIAYLSPLLVLDKLTSLWLLIPLFCISYPVGMAVVITLACRVEWNNLFKFDK